MLGTPVTIDASNHQDTEKWMTGVALQRMKELGTLDRLTHEFGWWLGPSCEDPLNQVLKVACRCGWQFKKLLTTAYLTTASSVIKDALTEHALFRSDPNHYTYYPAHASGH